MTRVTFAVVRLLFMEVQPTDGRTPTSTCDCTSTRGCTKGVRQECTLPSKAASRGVGGQALGSGKVGREARAADPARSLKWSAKEGTGVASNVTDTAPPPRRAASTGVVAETQGEGRTGSPRPPGPFSSPPLSPQGCHSP